MVGDHIYYAGKYQELVTAVSDLDFSNFQRIQRTYELVTPAMTFPSPECLYMSYSTYSDNSQIYTARIRYDQTEFETVQQTNTPGNKHRIFPSIDGDKIYYAYMHDVDNYWQVVTAQSNLDLTGYDETQRTFYSEDDAYPYEPAIHYGHVRFYVSGEKIFYAWAYNDIHDNTQIWTAEMNKDDTIWTATKRTDTPIDKWRPEIAVVGGKTYLTWWEGDGAWTGGQIFTGTIGSNIVSKSSSYGLGMDEAADITGFINAKRYMTEDGSFSGKSVWAGTDIGWNYVVMTYDKSNLRIYVNGYLFRDEPFVQEILQNPYSLMIGDDFMGYIDEVRISDTALTAEEIEQRYSSIMDVFDTPVLLSPGNGTFLGHLYPEFQWSPSAGIGVTYTLQYALNSIFSQEVVTVEGLSETSYVPVEALQDNSTYFWRVEAIDEDGHHSGYQSHPFSFTTSVDYPALPIPLPYADCQANSEAEGYACGNAIDGNSGTIWHTRWGPGSPTHPHQIIVSLVDPAMVCGFRYLPRQDMENGRIESFRFYVSQDGVNWLEMLHDSFSNSQLEQEWRFTPVPAAFIRLEALNEVNENPISSIAELTILELEGPAPLAITPNETAVQILESSVFTASGGTPPYTFNLWQNESGATLTDNEDGTADYVAGDSEGIDIVRVTCAAGDHADATITIMYEAPAPTPLTISPGETAVNTLESAIFTAEGGTSPYTFTLWHDESGATLIDNGDGTALYTAGDSEGTDIVRATDDAGDHADATITVIEAGGECIPIPLPYASCQANSEAGGYTCGNAIDGNSNTIWHTQWGAGSPTHPHQITVSLVEPVMVCGFRYLPRQDMENGRIEAFRLYVSDDGANWVEILYDSFQNTTEEQEWTFTPVPARFMRLESLNEVNGNIWTSMAEMILLAN